MRDKANGDFVEHKGDIKFAFSVKGPQDTIIVEKTLLGMTYQSRAYKVLQTVKAYEPWLEHAEVI